MGKFTLFTDKNVEFKVGHDNPRERKLNTNYFVNDSRITMIAKLQNGISQSETLPHYAEYPPFLFTLKSSGCTHTLQHCTDYSWYKPSEIRYSWYDRQMTVTKRHISLSAIISLRNTPCNIRLWIMLIRCFTLPLFTLLTVRFNVFGDLITNKNWNT